MVKEISKNDFRELLSFTNKESFFTFNNKFYIQVDGVANIFPLDLMLANIYLSRHEENWINKCPKDFKPGFYRRCADDIFVIFESPEPAHSFRGEISFKRHYINFTVEQNNIGSLSFLDVKICRKNGKFVTSVYRKQHLLESLPVMKVSFQRTKRGDFSTHYFIGVLAYVLISRHFILKSIIS